MQTCKLPFPPSRRPITGAASFWAGLERSSRQYQFLAPRYDAHCVRIKALRIEAIDLLHLERGDTVVDVGCGTGLSFPYPVERIGGDGHLFGIEPSAAMMTQSRRRVERTGWRNVTLIEAPVGIAAIPEPAANAMLFCFTHDVLRTPASLANLLAALQPQGRVAVAGAKFATSWLAPLNLWLLARCRRYLTTFEGLAAPWSHLKAKVPARRVASRHRSTAYGAGGALPRPPANSQATSFPFISQGVQPC